MPTGSLNAIVEYIRQIAGRKPTVNVTDGQLLERFIAERDENAFSTLVQRHGPLVLTVCRRVLPNVQDVQDAFQATFLVLVRKASSIAKKNQWRVGFTAWLTEQPCEQKSIWHVNTRWTAKSKEHLRRIACKR